METLTMSVIQVTRCVAPTGAAIAFTPRNIVSDCVNVAGCGASIDNSDAILDQIDTSSWSGSTRAFL
jgi:hypothetical protein